MNHEDHGFSESAFAVMLERLVPSGQIRSEICLMKDTKPDRYSSNLFSLFALAIFSSFSFFLLLFIKGRMRSCFFFFPFFFSFRLLLSFFSRHTQTSRRRRIFSFPFPLLKVPASYVSYIDDSYIETMDIPKEILHTRFEAPVPLNLSFRVTSRRIDHAASLFSAEFWSLRCSESLCDCIAMEITRILYACHYS